MKRSRRHLRRAEGTLEYVIIISMVMVCAVVGLWHGYFAAIQQVSFEKKICIDCESDEILVDDLEGEAGDEEAKPNTEAGSDHGEETGDQEGPRKLEEVAAKDDFKTVNPMYRSIAFLVGNVFGSAHMMAFLENAFGWS